MHCCQHHRKPEQERRPKSTAHNPNPSPNRRSLIKISLSFFVLFSTKGK